MLNSDMKKSYFLLVFGEGSSNFWAVMWFHIMEELKNIAVHQRETSNIYIYETEGSRSWGFGLELELSEQ